MGQRKAGSPGKQRGKQLAANTMWDQTAEGPRTGLPEAVKVGRRATHMRIVVWVCLVLFPFAVFGNILVLADRFAGEGEDTSSTEAAFVETKSVALLTVSQWLGTDPAPLPGGEIVGWDSAKTQVWDPPVDKSGQPRNGQPETYRVESHKVTVAASGGSLYHAAVTVGYDEVNGAVALSSPSLMPYVPANESWSPEEFPNHTKSIVSDELQTAVKNWAAAYTSGDPKLLIQTVRDTDTTHSYLPLSGARLRDVAAQGAWVADPLIAGDDPDPGEVFVRVTAAIDWAASPIKEANSAPEIAFDLLVQDADTAAPVVVAWGGPGDGPDLVRHQNAITTRKVTADDPDFELEDTPDVVLDDEDDFGDSPAPAAAPEKKAEKKSAKKSSKKSKKSTKKSKKDKKDKS